MSFTRNRSRLSREVRWKLPSRPHTEGSESSGEQVAARGLRPPGAPGSDGVACRDSNSGRGSRCHYIVECILTVCYRKRLAIPHSEGEGPVKFSLLYEIECPRPWKEDSLYNCFWEALEQVKVAEEVGFHTVWSVEHHFLDQFSVSSAPEVWLSAVAQHTERIRIGHGVRLLPFKYNAPRALGRDGRGARHHEQGPPRDSAPDAQPRPSSCWASASIPTRRATNGTRRCA